ncbi:aminoglycoside 3'-phosphotransferase [Kribbella shirazensis]|uniref:Streptomycin 3'-kinase n=1 Tax=Kribbella shirazensis TaxID=1105143 RepID=A0A7X5VJP9_9ACTN|nr:aminoglycoside 3'-phosphotransferase [Kribbella shirazensis]NIK62472.1 streptomycin 3'-kinase [Kribbella shirazensis]
MLAPPGDGWTAVEIGESDTSVFRRGDVFAKCCGPAGVAELAAERDRIEWLASTGLPGATVVDWLELPSGGACQVTSAVPGLPGDALAPVSRERAMRSLGGILRELHALTDCPFERPLASVIATAEDVVRRDAVNPAFLTDEWRKVAPAELLAEVVAERPYVESVLEPVVCHGDACLPNIFFDPDTLEVTGLIDLGRLGVADRYVDLALTTIQLHDEWSADPGPFLASYGVPNPDPRRLYFFRLLDPLTWG